MSCDNSCDTPSNFDPSGGGNAISSVSGGTSFATGPVLDFFNQFGNNYALWWGVAGNTVTATVFEVGGPLAGFSAGTESAVTVTLANSNGISFGMTTSAVTASYNAVRSISAGSTSGAVQQVSFMDSPTVSFGMTPDTVTMQTIPPVSAFAWLSETGFNNSRIQGSPGRVSLCSVPVPVPLSVTAVWLKASFTHNTNSTLGFTLSHAVYSLNAGVATRLSSASRSFSMASSENDFNVTGFRWWSIPASYNLTAGDYMFGYWGSQAGNNTFVYGGVQSSNQAITTYAGDVNLTGNGGPWLNGILTTATTSAFPANFAQGAYDRTGTLGRIGVPSVLLLGTY